MPLTVMTCTDCGGQYLKRHATHQWECRDCGGTAYTFAPKKTHCDPIEPDCVFDATSWDDGLAEGIEGAVLRCKTHGLLAPQEIYEQAFQDD